MTIHVVKSLADVLTRPLAVAGLIALLGAGLRIRGYRRLASGLTGIAVLIVGLGSLSPVGDVLLAPLERTFPQLVDGPAARGAAFIVVLGTGYSPAPAIPVTAAIDPEGLARIVEGIRLAKFYSLPLIASGGASEGHFPSALGYAALARDLGIKADALIVSPAGIDTRGEAAIIAGLVGSRPFILVTSASHMPRAVLLLRRAGAQPLPAPTAQHGLGEEPLDWHRWIPGSMGLRKTELALHEYFGLLAIRLGWD